jgi:hypothetical protein
MGCHSAMKKNEVWPLDESPGKHIHWKKPIPKLIYCIIPHFLNDKTIETENRFMNSQLLGAKDSTEGEEVHIPKRMTGILKVIKFFYHDE